MLATDTENLRGRAWCAGALAKFSAPADLAVPALVAALRDPSDEVRSVAVLSLEQYPEAADRSRAALRKAVGDAHWKVRGNAACALGKLDASDAGVVALGAALRDVTPYVRGCAARALGGLWPFARRMLPALRAAERDEDPHVRAMAAAAVVRLEAVEGRPRADGYPKDDEP